MIDRSPLLAAHRGRRRVAGVMAALIGAAAVGRGAQPESPGEVAGYLKPLPAPIRTSVAHSPFGMAATGSPEATDAAVAILERGGNAVDAAVAAALMLGVSDPDASGLGGMTYMLIRLADGRTLAIDGTAPIPSAINPAKLQELKENDRLLGYEVAAVPTTLAVLELARARYGTMDLAELIQPAIEIAESGYRVNPTQVVWSNVYYEQILSSGYLRLIALGENTVVGRPVDEDIAIGRPGDLRCRPDLAATLRQLQREGPASFYRGAIADRIEADMQANGGFIRKVDLATVRVREVQPLTTTYRGHRVFSFPPPGGGSTVVETLNILGTYPAELLAEDSPWRHQLLIEALRISSADRPVTTPDPYGSAFLTPQTLSLEHARDRARLITPAQPIADARLRGPTAPECAPSGESTTQVSVGDASGNVVSLTQTLGRSFGGKVATPGLGFPYNSLLESFNFDKPQCPGYLQPRAKIPIDMAPTIVVNEDGTLLAALGAPGSTRIPAIITNVISNLVDRRMGLVEAVGAPRILPGGMTRADHLIEVAGPITGADVDELERMGYEKIERMIYPPASRRFVLFGGVNAVGWDAVAMTFVGVGDGRRWGDARGPRVVAAACPPR